VETTTIKLRHLRARCLVSSTRRQTPDLVVPVVVPMTTLIVIRRSRANPRRLRFFARVVNGLCEQNTIARQRAELRGTELHVVGPVVLFVEIRGTTRRRLANSRVCAPDVIRQSRLAAQHRP